MRVLRTVLVAALLALAAAGCGVSSEQVISANGSTKGTDAGAQAGTRSTGSGQASNDSKASATVTAVALQRVVDETRAANSGRFEATVALSVTGSTDLTMKMSGAFDLDARRFSSELDMSDLLGDLGGSDSLNQSLGSMKVRQFIDGDTAYVQVPGFGGADGSWVAMSLDADTAGGLMDNRGGLANPDDMLAQLRGVTGPLTEVGHESIGGVDTLHQRGTIDLKKVLADHADGLSASARAQLEGQLDELGGSGEMPVEVWIGADGLLRQQRVTMDVPGGKGTMSMTITLLDLGKPVDLTPPPADQVRRIDPNDPGSLGKLFEDLGPGA